MAKLFMPGPVEKSAVLSYDKVYRYYLTRRWDNHKPTLTWIMLNPSTADAERDDHTIRKCMRFAHQWGFGSIFVANLFAFRATSPLALRMAKLDVVGLENGRWIMQACVGARKIICAWGAHGEYMQRGDYVKRWLAPTVTLYKLGTCANGQPMHPLILPYSAELELYA